MADIRYLVLVGVLPDVLLNNDSVETFHRISASPRRRKETSHLDHLRCNGCYCTYLHGFLLRHNLSVPTSVVFLDEDPGRLERYLCPHGCHHRTGLPLQRLRCNHGFHICSASRMDHFRSTIKPEDEDRSHSVDGNGLCVSYIFTIGQADR